MLTPRSLHWEPLDYQDGVALTWRWALAWDNAVPVPSTMSSLHLRAASSHICLKHYKPWGAGRNHTCNLKWSIATDRCHQWQSQSGLVLEAWSAADVNVTVEFPGYWNLCLHPPTHMEVLGLSMDTCSHKRSPPFTTPLNAEIPTSESATAYVLRVPKPQKAAQINIFQTKKCWKSLLLAALHGHVHFSTGEQTEHCWILASQTRHCMG